MCGRKLVGHQVVDCSDCSTCKYESIGSEVLYRDGCFSRERYYFRGWLHDLGWAIFTNGWSGPETAITVDRIMPIRTFEVSEPA